MVKTSLSLYLASSPSQPKYLLDLFFANNQTPGWLFHLFWVVISVSQSMSLSHPREHMFSAASLLLIPAIFNAFLLPE